MLKNKSNIRLHPLILIIIGTVVGVLISRYLYNSGSQISSTRTLQNQREYRNINMSNWSKDVAIGYFSGKGEIPHDYLATSDTMLENYASQGGSAPPRLILMKNIQSLVSDKSSYINDITNPSNTCIVIYSTNGFDSIESWVGSGRKLSNEEKIVVGKRTASIYQHMPSKEDTGIYNSLSTGKSFVGFLAIGNNDSSSYYFQTCNFDYKDDFVHVIKSLQLRPDLLQEFAN